MSRETSMSQKPQPEPKIETTTVTVRSVETMPRWGNARAKVRETKISLPRVRALERPPE